MTRLIGLVLLCFVGFYGYDFAKYERRVDAVYYPDRHNLLDDKEVRNIGSVEACRIWAFEMARISGDPDLIIGDYECGIDPLRDQPHPDVILYRETVQ